MQTLKVLLVSLVAHNSVVKQAGNGHGYSRDKDDNRIIGQWLRSRI